MGQTAPSPQVSPGVVRKKNRVNSSCRQRETVGIRKYWSLIGCKPVT